MLIFDPNTWIKYFKKIPFGRRLKLKWISFLNFDKFKSLDPEQISINISRRSLIFKYIHKQVSLLPLKLS